MTSPLSSVSGFDFQRATVLAGIQKQFNRRVAERSAVINSDYAVKIGAVQRDIPRWEAFRDDLDKTRIIVAGALGRLKSIQSMLDQTIQTVNKARLDPDIESTHEGYRSTFDSYLRSIRSRSDSNNDTPNLLGNTGARELAVPLSVNGAIMPVRQSYMGTSYSIVDDDGYLWRPDYKGELLRRYDSYPDTPTNISGNLSTGIRLDSADGSDVSFTIAPGTAGAKQYSGTLAVEGNGAFDAWYYDGLATAEGRERALVDLDSAKATIKAQIQRYQGVLTGIDHQARRASGVIKEVQERTIKLVAEQEKASARAQAEGQQQLNAVADAIAHSQAMSGLFVNMLGMYKVDQGSNQLVGTNAAARVFGAFVDLGV
ncbi:MAG: hypothetical protein IPM60_04090 [Rhodospirillales bacterium]|nr:hypothetical protein [Rhodospirillales bacterium]